MFDYIDVKYISLLSSYLRNFRKTGSRVWNFSCPFCGDSTKNRLKARGYMYESKGKPTVCCHNCNEPMWLQKLIECVAPHLVSDYRFEKLKEGHQEAKPEKHTFKTAVTFGRSKRDKLIDSGCELLTDLPKNHSVNLYVASRKIPQDQISSADKLEGLHSTYKDKLDKSPKLVIPFYKKNGELFAVQLRSLSNYGLRYVTIKIDPEYPLIFGLNSISLDKEVFIFEGPIDSMFLPNSIAVAGSALPRAKEFVSIENSIYVFDNDRRNKDLLSTISQCIDDDYSICLMPDSIKAKDMNDLILAGWNSEQLVELIRENTYKGIKARLAFSSWSKCDFKRRGIQ
jgi:hypothetical protein